MRAELENTNLLRLREYGSMKAGDYFILDGRLFFKTVYDLSEIERRFGIVK